jgi:hypothetical protein
MFLLCHAEIKAAIPVNKSGRRNTLKKVMRNGEPVPVKLNGAPGQPSTK